MPSRRCKQPSGTADAGAGRRAGGGLLDCSETTAERRNSIGGRIAIRRPAARRFNVRRFHLMLSYFGRLNAIVHLAG
ncbi:hypothetical protein BSIN_1267 [Burkholderia singularis]|uniref:Uncharacterized protein n=1 Tax=Burkholderia singularis TaxID=1503053 RepID=A0A238GYG3_9BURK|nr:hypothetical protein BSIN_1267 [Burkholderia singularis]